MKQASTISEFCQRYKIARGTVYNEVKRGKLKISKVGAKSLIMVEDEQAWLKNMRTLPAHPSVHARSEVKREQM